MASESQSSNWDITECFRGATMEDVDVKPDKKKGKSSVKAEEKAKALEDAKAVEQAKIDVEFNTLLTTSQAKCKHTCVVVALQGKSKQGGIFCPPDCTFVIDNNDKEQIKQVKKAIVEKARAWKASNPDVENACWLIETHGQCVEPITAIGGLVRGLKNIPKSEPKQEEKRESKRKRS